MQNLGFYGLHLRHPHVTSLTLPDLHGGNRYHNQSQIMDVADGYISRGYPISLIIIDYYNWAPSPLGDETLPKACWPDPKAMVDSLKEKGVELMISP